MTQTSINNDVLSALNDLFKQTKSSKHSPHHHYGLVLGSPNAGKTTLFEQSTLQHYQHITLNGDEVNLWQNDKASFFELPNSEQSTLSAFNTATRKKISNKSINSIIICLDIIESIKISPRDFISYLQALQHQIITVSSACKVKPRLSIFYTKLDGVAGFCSTFPKNCDEQWGYEFKPYPNNESLLKQNTSLFDEQIKTLHSDILSRLHHNDDELSRYLIREFPLQMESMRNMVAACVKHLSNEFCVSHGIFFTSAMQSNQAHDRLSQHVAKTFALTVNQNIPQSTQQKSRFIQGALEQCITATNKNTDQRNNGAIIAATLCSISVISLTSLLYLSNQSALQKAQNEISLYNKFNQPQTNNLPAIEHLLAADKTLGSMHAIFPLPSIRQYQQRINSQYKQHLGNQFLPQLAHEIEQTLTKNDLSLTERYAALKAYSMLSSEEHLDEGFLIAWFEPRWSKTLSNKQLNQKLHHLHQALKRPYIGLTLDSNILQSSQNYFQALPKSFLYYELIKDKLSTKTHYFNLKNFQLTTQHIPVIYTKQQFEYVYMKQLPNLANMLERDRFVLGANENSDIRKQLRDSYSEKYVRFWNSYIKGSQPLAFHNYKEGVTNLVNFSQETSSIEQLSYFIQSNTQNFSKPVKAVENIFNTKISDHFIAINLVSARQLKTLRPIILELSHYFETLSNTKNPTPIAFKIAQNRFLGQTIDPLSQLYSAIEQFPSPVKEWTNSTANNAWSLILNDAKTHINHQWNTNVLAQYNAVVKTNFPFNRQSDKDISLNDFSQFFSHQGTLELFFKQYLAPFINAQNAQWSSKKLNGFQLPISKKNLTELTKANIIREIFFKGKRNEPTVRFSMHTMTLGETVEHFSLFINGQQLDEDQDNKKSKEFIWPGNANKPGAIVEIEKPSGEISKLKENGVWGWFRMLAKSEFNAIKNHPNNYLLKLDISGSDSQFIVSTHSPLNPFIPNLLASFKLEKDIA